MNKIRNISAVILLLVVSINGSLSAQIKDGQSNAWIKNNSAMDTVITVELDNVTFEEALNAISKESGIIFNYIRDRLPLNQIVSVDMQDVPVSDILAKILNDTNTGLIIASSDFFVIISLEDKYSYGAIKGKVTEEETQKPLSGANIVVRGTSLGTSTNSEGSFTISKLSPGIYVLEASHIGYEKVRLNNILISLGDTVETFFELPEKTASLNEIIITPGYFSLMKNKTTTVNTIRAEQLKNYPQSGEDIYRAVERLPGLAGNDISAKLTVRGGEQDEVLVLFDGMEIYDPFHLRDIGGTISFIDIDAINSAEIITGAFPAEYGNRLSGVFNMKTGSTALEKPRTSVSVSLMKSKFLSEGSFDRGKGYWMLLGRRGYNDQSSGIFRDSDRYKPNYYDIYSKVQYFLNDNNSISANLLTTGDKAEDYNKYVEETLFGNYKDTYSWFTWDSQLNPQISTRTIFSFGMIDQDRLSQDFDNNKIGFESRNNREFDYIGLKQDWDFQVSNNSLMKIGFQIRRFSADYDYFSWYNFGNSNFDPYDVIDIDVYKKGTETGLYYSNKFRINPSLNAELGLRYDHFSWTDDANFSPRVNLAYNIGESTVVRAGWGHFYQAQGIHMMNVIDGESTYYPAELSKHLVAGMEHKYNNGINLRLELYVKKLKSIRPRYTNLGYNIDFTPETNFLRTRIEPEKGESNGFEFYLYKNNNGKHNWWLNYTNSYVYEFDDGEKIPRGFDQPHTINFDYSYTHDDSWAFFVAWKYHSGWPYTELGLNITGKSPEGVYNWEWAVEKMNGKRYPPYHRMDIKINKYFNTSMGRVSVFFEIRNLYDRENVRQYIYYLQHLNSEYDYSLRKSEGNWTSRFPLFGFSIDFNK